MIDQPPPDAALAGRLAAEVTGAAPVAVTRFPTGLQHYVFEAIFADRAPIVLRLNRARERAIMAGALRLNRQLRPLGVPLPEILAADVESDYPCLVLERFAGTDLGDVIATLPDDRLAAIAGRVADAQALVAATPTAGRYGFAVAPEDAPHASWTEMLRADIARSRGRIVEAGLFDLAPVARLEALVDAHRDALDAIPATPFLHDTTTKNVIVSPGGGFSGIVDVDDLCFGDPRFAPALTLVALMVSDGPRRYVEAWLGLQGAAADDLFRLYVALILVGFMSEHGQLFNGNQKPSAPEARARLLELLSEVTSGLRPTP